MSQTTHLKCIVNKRIKLDTSFHMVVTFHFRPQRIHDNYFPLYEMNLIKLDTILFPRTGRIDGVLPMKTAIQFEFQLPAAG